MMRRTALRCIEHAGTARTVPSSRVPARAVQPDGRVCRAESHAVFSALSNGTTHDRARYGAMTRYIVQRRLALPSSSPTHSGHYAFGAPRMSRFSMAIDFVMSRVLYMPTRRAASSNMLLRREMTTNCALRVRSLM